MNKIIKFGEELEGYNIPVLNEREIRAAAGLLFLATFLSLMFIVFKGNFVPIKYIITIFLTDFLIRVFINPKFAPSLILGRLIVRNQTPEYVGAAQKKFAWIIGVVLASAMFVFFNIVNAYSIFTGLICLICLIFLFFESAFGICLGCKFYPVFFKDNVQYCPGEVCDVKNKQNIQKTSLGQFVVLLAFVVFVLLLVYLMNDNFAIQPYDLFRGKDI
jgi:predicted outer membrane lipoprotein